MPDTFRYCRNNEAPMFTSVSPLGKGVGKMNSILMGTYIKILDEAGDWFKVRAFGDGWMKKSDLTDEVSLKIFYLDVGQGDGALIELDKTRILIDAGPTDNMYNYLTKWQYKYLLAADKKVHIDFLFVSHFDKDHFRGFTELISDTRFTFGEILHPGILKFFSESNPYNSGLGTTVENGNETYLTRIFDDLVAESDPAPFNTEVKPFVEAVKTAHAQGRVGAVKRVKVGDVFANQTVDARPFSIEAIGPFTESINGADAYVYFEDDGVTINGHSLVLKMTFGSRTYLFGGDLNSLSETYLLSKYGASNPLEVDVAKSCHHGASDFTTDFMAKVNPFATVISSGDNEGYAHPRADAIGCAGKYARSSRPLVFSTELARSTDLENEKVLYGMINSRCDGTRIFFSQMKEQKKKSDLWDSYEV